MLAGVFALLERSLRVDSRAWGPHLARFGLIVAIYIAVTVIEATSARFGAPGLHFIRSIGHLNLTFLTLLGVGFFSTAITEEKEEDTLGLMLMAGISPLGILLGKAGGRLIQAVLLIAVQYPFTLLSITLGGVTQDQVRMMYAAIFAYLAMLSGIGLLCSTIASRNRTASLRLGLIILAYWLIPLASRQILAHLGTSLAFLQPIFGVLSESCVFLQMGAIMTTGVQPDMINVQVVTNLLIGAAGFFLSWASFSIAARQPATEADSRGIVTRSVGVGRWISPGRPRNVPVVWKDFHFIAGGFVAIILRVIGYLSLYLVAWMTTDGVFGGRWGGGRSRETIGFYLVLLMFAGALDAAWIVSKSLHDEIRGQTLGTLLLLPVSSGKVMYSKVAGVLLCWLPGPTILFYMMLLPEDGRQCVKDFFRHPGPPFWLICHLIFAPHAAAVFAMFVRWGAFPLGLGAALGSFMLSISIFQTLRVGDNDLIVWGVGVMLLALSAISHLVVWLRAETLARQ